MTPATLLPQALQAIIKRNYTMTQSHGDRGTNKG
jgi:hypothetical protein